MTAKSNQSKSDQLLFKQQSFWDQASGADQQKAFNFCEEYKIFLDQAKTEIQIIAEVSQMAQRQGFKLADLDQPLAAQAKKLIFINRHKSAALVQLAKNNFSGQIKFILSHVDSPRLDLKSRPLYEDAGLAYLKTHYYGGIRKYHWPVKPLMMIGKVVLKNGEEIDFNIGEKPNDPLFVISDLLPHLDKKEADQPKTQGEELNIIVGSIPVKDKKAKDRVKLAALEWLDKNYKISEVDLFTADIRFVPAFPARDIGFDRSMIAGYGQDDSACVYASAKAFLDADDNHAKICYLTDKEEIASDGATGAKSLFLENVLEYLLKQTKTQMSVYDLFRRSQGLSADTTGAYDPDYKDKQDLTNAIRLGHGVVVEKHNGWGGKYYSIDAEPKYLRQIIDLFDRQKIAWQTGHTGKIDLGGGGTVAVYLANRNMEIADIGVPVLNLHSPYELISKADLYSAYKGYKAFLEA